ncbi:MAG: antitoxin ParD1/3/4 [Acidobacteriaceae bacterium]|jgi:plasmid stabilization system protein ParE|nr:antitoxin ParD1/3/4 [Acidobacteriaceae bacterium]MEA2263666.1 antitoxin ParD1/3/4 [Acidobacteriaceae bacterium]MEA3005757.1 antitoxin ParD1/3/4 [Acidobacteriaceae bacterium]
MSLYLLTPQAEDDLFDIWSYIAQDSLDAANRVETQIYAACAFLASTPQAGHIRLDLTNRSVRFWTLPNYSHYVIVYDPACDPLRIIRILHGARDIRRSLTTPR